MDKDGLILFEKFLILSRKIFDHAARAVSLKDILGEFSKMLMESSGCDVVGLWLKEGNKIYCCETSSKATEPFRFDTAPQSRTGAGKPPAFCHKSNPLGRLCFAIAGGDIDRSLPCFTSNGSFWTGDALTNPLLAPAARQKRPGKTHRAEKDRSIAIIPLGTGNENNGLLILKIPKPNFFKKEEIEFYETAAQVFSFAWQNRQTQLALRERIKELTCLYGISQLSGQEGASLDVILQGIVEHLPGAWQRPEIAHGRIIFDGQVYQTPGFQDGTRKLSTKIMVHGQKHGTVEIVYAGDQLGGDETPFLKEERNLIDTVAMQIALIIQRKRAEDEKAKFSEQLRHADRLATIGQLAAGVAHELNEPLGSILGFSQFVKKTPGLADQAARDIDKIIKASLHAREIIKKLMLFGRQAPLQKARVNLNQIVEEGLYFIESRCAKEGIELTRMLAPELPEITADPSQLNQVLVNLVVNAVQAMPKGGKLTIQTGYSKKHIYLIVEDTGMGMNDEQLDRVFVPFYTTKEVGEGTGLGLPVVHGIISSHGGSIRVESQPGRGARFEIRLPRN